MWDNLIRATDWEANGRAGMDSPVEAHEEFDVEAQKALCTFHPRSSFGFERQLFTRAITPRAIRPADLLQSAGKRGMF